MSTIWPPRFGRRSPTSRNRRSAKQDNSLQTIALHIEMLDIGDAAQALAMRLIDELERDRAAKFRFSQDARRFVARRSRLREILSAYSGDAPERLSFAQGPNGKPVLQRSALHFSLSHSRGLMMLAIADVEVGCDIEWIDDDLEWQPLADRLFTSAERDMLRRLDNTPARRAFFDCWSRKEAYVKAVGMGLSLPLDTFEVSVGREARLFPSNGWAIADASPNPRYSGAVVANTPTLLLDFNPH